VKNMVESQDMGLKYLLIQVSASVCETAGGIEGELEVYRI